MVVARILQKAVKLAKGSLQSTDNWKKQGFNSIEGIRSTGSSVNSVFFKEINKFWLGFTMVVYDKIYLEAYINNKYICLKIILHNYYELLSDATDFLACWKIHDY